MLAGDTRERDLSWLDGTVATALSPAEDAMLFVEGFEGGGPQYSFFLRRADSGIPVRLGDGSATDLSADGRWVLGYPPSQLARIVVTPTGAGETRSIPLASLEAIMSVSWLPDGRRALFVASTDALPVVVSRLDVATGRRERWRELRPADPAGVTDIMNVTMTPAGRQYAYTYLRSLTDLSLIEGLR